MVKFLPYLLESECMIKVHQYQLESECVKIHQYQSESECAPLVNYYVPIYQIHQYIIIMSVCVKVHQYQLEYVCVRNNVNDIMFQYIESISAI